MCCSGYRSGCLWGKCGTAGLSSSWFRAICAAALLEFLQVFVWTRVADVTSILAAATGSGLGLLAMRRTGVAGATAPRGSVQWARFRKVLPLAVGVGLWLVVIVAVFWYPFQFDGHYEFAAQRWKSFNKVPLAAYQTSDEYRAFTELLHKTLFFAPLGALLGAIAPQILRRRGLYLVSAVVFLVGVATSIEIGKVFLPGKVLDTASWLLEVLGGCAGLWAAIVLRPILVRSAPLQESHERPQTLERTSSVPETRSRPHGQGALQPGADWLLGSRTRSSLEVAIVNKYAIGYAIAAPIVMGLLLWWVTGLPQVPYNLRKVLHPDFPLLSAALICTALLWTTTFPMWLARQLRQHRSYLVLYPLATIGHAAVAWLILYIGVEPIRIHKIVASPVLGWPWEWETIGRFLRYTVVYRCSRWQAPC